MRNFIFLLLIATAIQIASCKKSAPPPVPPKPTLSIPPKALSVHTILTDSRDTTLNILDTTTNFDMRDTIHGIIETQNALNGTSLLGTWYYVKTGQMIAQSSATLSAGTNLSHFDLMNAHRWPRGKYKLYVLVDSVLRDSAQFTIGE